MELAVRRDIVIETLRFSIPFTVELWLETPPFPCYPDNLGDKEYMRTVFEETKGRPNDNELIFRRKGPNLPLDANRES